MSDITKANSPNPMTVYAMATLLFLLTAAYSYFVLFSTQIVHIFITESNTSPSFLFNVMVKPYWGWIGAAWICLCINTRWMYFFLQKREAEGLLSCSITHILWIFTGFLLHTVALVSPFVSQGYVIR